MRKKIILFSAGLILAVSGFAVYSYLTGANLFRPSIHVASQDRGPVALPKESNIANPVFEGRDADMRLEYLLTAKEVIPRGKGVYDLILPRATYYNKDKDNTLILITSDAGSIVTDSLGAKSARPTLRGGSLTGHACLTYGPQNSFVPGTDDLQPGEIQVRFSDDINFSYVDHTMESNGKITVRGDIRDQKDDHKISFNGEHLILSFNNDKRRIEYLRIDRGDKLTISNVFFSSTGGDSISPFASALSPATPKLPENNNLPAPTAASPAARSSGTPAPAATSPDAKLKPAKIPTTYRLAFARDVKAAVGDRTLLSDEMSIIFQGSSADVAEDQKSGTTPAPTPATPDASPHQPSQEAPPPATVNPAAPAPPAAPPASVVGDDLTITWTGPMEMRPMADGAVKLTDRKDRIFEAASFEGRPVTLTDGDARLVHAGRIWYQTASQGIHLERGGLAQIDLTENGAGQTENGAGHLVCQGLDWERAAGKMHIVGPAQCDGPLSALNRGPDNTAHAPSKSSEKLFAQWSGAADLSLAQVADPGKPGKAKSVIRHAVLTGHVDIHQPTFAIRSDSLDALVANSPQGKQAIEHLLAVGNVKVDSYRDGSTAAHENPQSVEGDQLELFTVLSARTHLPEPDHLLVDGHAHAITNQPDRRDPARFMHSEIFTPKLAVQLEPKVAGADVARASDALGSFTAKEIRAVAGVKIELTGYAKDKIVATADALSAHALGDDAKFYKAALQGRPAVEGSNAAPAEAAQITQGENHITGATLLLDQRDQSIEIPGPGQFVFLPPAKKTTDKPPDDNPVQITWEDHMKYDGKAYYADFVGAVKAMAIGKPNQESELTSDTLHVTFSSKKPDKTAAANPAQTGEGKLTEIRAHGNVVARGATYDDQHKLLTGMLLKNVDTLIYNDEKKIMTIPGRGQLLVEDYRPTTAAPSKTSPPKANQNDSRGATAFTWQDSLIYNGNDGTIQLKKNVIMHHRPLNPIAMTPAAMQNNAKPSKKSAAAPPAVTDIWLQCNELTALLAHEKGTATTSNPVALGNNEGAKVTQVIATGGPDGRAILDANPVKLAADMLEYDKVNNLAKAISRGTFPAHAESPDWGLLNADQIIWDMTKDARSKDDSITLIRPRITSP